LNAFITSLNFKEGGTNVFEMVFDMIQAELSILLANSVKASVSQSQLDSLFDIWDKVKDLGKSGSSAYLDLPRVVSLLIDYVSAAQSLERMISNGR
jgi:hypothetical protein